MMNVLDIQSVRGDEYYTLRKDVEAIADNMVIYGGMRIWCPFDDDTSEFPKVLRERGYDVVNTCTDFFTTDIPAGCNCIVSNPPFSRKKEILKRIDKLGLQYALILPFLFLNDGVPLDYGHQIMLFRKRMHFRIPDGVELNKPRTNCFVLSNGLLRREFTIVR